MNALIEQLWWLIACAIACERLTELVHNSKIFMPLRSMISRVAYPSDKPPSKWWHFRRRAAMFASSAMSCGYCLSVWMAMPFAVWLSFRYKDNDHWSGFAVNMLARLLVVHGLSNLYHVAYVLVERGRVNTYDITHIVKVEDPTLTEQFKPATPNTASGEVDSQPFDPEITGEFKLPE